MQLNIRTREARPRRQLLGTSGRFGVSSESGGRRPGWPPALAGRRL